MTISYQTTTLESEINSYETATHILTGCGISDANSSPSSTSPSSVIAMRASLKAVLVLSFSFAGSLARQKSAAAVDIFVLVGRNSWNNEFVFFYYFYLKNFGAILPRYKYQSKSVVLNRCVSGTTEIVRWWRYIYGYTATLYYMSIWCPTTRWSMTTQIF